MQLIDPSHECEVSIGNLSRLIVDSASADPEFPGLPRDRESVGSVDHFFALANSPALSSATSKKIIRQDQLADLGMQRLHVDRRNGCRSGWRRSENLDGAIEQLRAPLRDLSS
jgi:hypothetical protein